MSASFYFLTRTIWPQHDEIDICEEKYCPNCRHQAFRRDCWECGAEGSFDGYEDDPLRYSPGERIECQTCYGEGSHCWCPNCGWDLLLSSEFNQPEHRGVAIMRFSA